MGAVTCIILGKAGARAFQTGEWIKHRFPEKVAFVQRPEKTKSRPRGHLKEGSPALGITPG